MIGEPRGPLRQHVGLRQGGGERQLRRRCGATPHFRHLVSQPVKELEERLGARLPNRTTCKVSRDWPPQLRALHAPAGRSRGNRASRSDLHAAPRGELRVQCRDDVRHTASSAGLQGLGGGGWPTHRTATPSRCRGHLVVAQCALAALGCIAQDDEPPTTRPPLLDQLGMQEVRFVEEFIPLCPGWTTDPLTSRIGRSVP
jgi:hypothetical protein